MRISLNIHDLDEGRIITALFGCIRKKKGCAIHPSPSLVRHQIMFILTIIIARGTLCPIPPYYLTSIHKKEAFAKIIWTHIAKEKLFHAISISEDEHLLKGRFFTKHGQCLELKTVRLVTDYKKIGSLAILIKTRRDWQSYRFQRKKEESVYLFTKSKKRKKTNPTNK